MKKDNIITEDNERFEYFKGLSAGCPEVHIPVMGDVATHPGIFDHPAIEVWKKVYIDNRPAWKLERVDTYLGG